ncbi:MAG: hypothetical protein AAGG08_19140 [Actinomycetota bacterium]
MTGVEDGGRRSRRVGVYPGSFDPPTVAHLAVSEAAVEQHALDELVWMVSHSALGKGEIEQPPFEHRIEVLHAVADRHGWLRIEVTELRLLSDIAEPFDVVIMGADKWHQIHEPHWYDDEHDRARQLGRLPTPAVAPRGDLHVPDHVRLDVDPAHSEVSSTAARNGAIHHMLDAAKDYVRRHGRWR